MTAIPTRRGRRASTRVTGHPLLRLIFDQVALRDDMNLRILAERAGVHHTSLSKIGRRGASLATLEACLNVLGFDLKAVPRPPKKLVLPVRK